jgi:hypothetical protein
VHGTIAADEIQDPVYQFLPFVVGQRTQRPDRSEVLRLIGITARATERALARDLNG